MDQPRHNIWKHQMLSSRIVALNTRTKRHNTKNAWNQKWRLQEAINFFHPTPWIIQYGSNFKRQFLRALQLLLNFCCLFETKLAASLIGGNTILQAVEALLIFIFHFERFMLLQLNKLEHWIILSNRTATEKKINNDEWINNNKKKVITCMVCKNSLPQAPQPN